MLERWSPAKPDAAGWEDAALVEKHVEKGILFLKDGEKGQDCHELHSPVNPSVLTRSGCHGDLWNWEAHGQMQLSSQPACKHLLGPSLLGYLSQELPG